MPIGVFDSGLGGLTVLEAFVRRLPEQDFLYLGDNANAPYGLRPPIEVYRLTIAGVQHLFDAGCGLVILAWIALWGSGVDEPWAGLGAPPRASGGCVVPTRKKNQFLRQ